MEKTKEKTKEKIKIKNNRGELIIENRSIKGLTAYDNNPRIHPDSQLNKLQKSISSFGFINPVIIDKNDVVIAGHGRIESAKKNKIKEVLTIKVSYLSDEEIREYRIADNQLTILGEWNFDLLKGELEDLSLVMNDSFDLDLLGFDKIELDGMFDGNIELNNIDNNENKYTTKITIPIYEPKNEKPELSDLYDKEKAMKLINEIEKSNLTEQEKDFLKHASYRLTVFQFDKIADFYAHSDGKIKDLMEKLALVIIDFDKAIENGYVKLSKELFDLYDKEHQNDEK